MSKIRELIESNSNSYRYWTVAWVLSDRRCELVVPIPDSTQTGIGPGVDRYRYYKLDNLCFTL